MSSWRDNEDAGDLSAMGAADASEWEDDAYEAAEDGWDDADADADTLASAGWGTDEDYGYYGEEY